MSSVQRFLRCMLSAMFLVNRVLLFEIHKPMQVKCTRNQETDRCKSIVTDAFDSHCAYRGWCFRTGLVMDSLLAAYVSGGSNRM